MKVFNIDVKKIKSSLKRYLPECVKVHSTGSMFRITLDNDVASIVDRLNASGIPAQSAKFFMYGLLKAVDFLKTEKFKEAMFYVNMILEINDICIDRMDLYASQKSQADIEIGLRDGKTTTSTLNALIHQMTVIPPEGVDFVANGRRESLLEVFK
jgi:hypothetical protein